VSKAGGPTQAIRDCDLEARNRQVKPKRIEFRKLMDIQQIHDASQSPVGIRALFPETNM